MNQKTNIIPRLLRIAAIAAPLATASAAVVDFYDISSSPTSGVGAAGNAGSVTTTAAYTDAWVVLGWTNDAGSVVNPDSALFNGTALTGLRISLGAGTGGYDGGNGGHELFYANIGALSAGTYNWSVNSTSTKPGTALWIVDGVQGLRDTATASYRDDDNGVTGGGAQHAFGFNLTNNVATAATVNPGDSFQDQTFTAEAGDVVINWFSSGAGLEQFSGTPNTATPLGFSADISQNVVGGGGSFLGGSEIASASGEAGIDGPAGGWFRTANSAIAFTVPEPSSSIMLLGAAGLLATRRRRSQA